MSASLRDAVLQVFERHRATPGAAFDEARFLDYLIAKPKHERAVHDSFAGLRRYNAFINDVQLRFGICFSLHDFEANHSLHRFVQRVAELQASRRSSLASFRHQQRHGFGWRTVFIGNLLALSLAVGAARISQLLAVALFFACLLANGVVAGFYLRWRAYRTRLLNRLQAGVGEHHA
jgi:hypothetical protein